MFAVIYPVYVRSNGMPVFDYAGAPCESFEEAQDLAKGYEDAKICNLTFAERTISNLFSGDDVTRVEYIVKNWGEIGEKVCFAARKERKDISMSDFLHHCTACGGDWGTMILTGIRELYPKVYEAIPDDMGVFSFSVLSDVVRLCGVSW